MLYYPCGLNKRTGKISEKLGEAMEKNEAETFLKRFYWSEWVRLEAIPQPVNHPYFKYILNNAWLLS